jgi:hypothetical protein
MTVLSQPRHPFIDQALNDAKTWCAGQVIDERPALVHAVRVAVTIGEHVPIPAPDLIAAALLHDAPEFAPAGLDLDVVLLSWYSAEVLRIVRTLQTEHVALDQPDPPVRVDDLPVLLASTADRIVAFDSLLRRAAASGNVRAFFAARPGLARLLPHFRACQAAAVGLIPDTMSTQLGQLLTTTRRAIIGQPLLQGPGHDG